MEILYQLGDLFLAAIPTVIVVFFFFLVLRWSFFRPIERIMAERKSRVEGARREAETLRTGAQEKNRTYQEALRKARSDVFSEQEAVRRTVLDERNAAVLQARSQVNEEIHVAKKRIAGEIETARGELETTGQQLAEEIVRAIISQPPQSPHQAGKA